MTDNAMTLDAGLSGLDAASWLARLEEIADEHGSFEPLGARHAAAFLDLGKSLIVTFESADHLRRHRKDGEPRGFDFARRLGWSVLALVADTDTWFRDPRVYGYVDRLIDDGFFEDFDRVLFYGAHAGGYAAAAFSVAAPGARVLALRPQATLDPAIAGWDTRHRRERRRNFTDRYGYAPAMVDAAMQAHVVLDPVPAPDAMHAALFQGENVERLTCAHLGWRIDTALDQMGILGPMIEAAMEARLDRLSFARLWRARRDNVGYLRALLAHLDRNARPQLAARLCRFAAARTDAPQFAARLARLETEAGITDAAE